MDPVNPPRHAQVVSTTSRDPHGVEIERPVLQTASIAPYQYNQQQPNNNQKDGHPSAAPNASLPTIEEVHSVPDPLIEHSEDSPDLARSIEASFKDWHGKTVRPWQMLACQQVLRRHVERVPSQRLRPLLLVRSTGGGKSAVRDVCGFICGGITLTIVPLLSLSADQTSKLTNLSSNQGLGKRLRVFNLDVIRSTNNNDFLRQRLESLSPESKTTIALFSSPQKLTRDPQWCQTITKCFQNGTLRFIAVDECHLYACHGMEFRQEFSDLKQVLFQCAKRWATTPIPILFMTATASLTMVSDLEALTGLSFCPTNDLIWPHCHSGVERRNISLNICFQDTPLRRIKRDLVKISRASGGRKIMIYSNSRKAIIDLHQKCRHQLNVLGIQKDLVLVHGNMYREQKFHNTNLFVGKPLVETCPTTRRLLRFDPVGYFATAGTTSSGIDCHEVDAVIFHGFPQSLEDLIQCSGRCGRSVTATFNTSSFTMIISLNSLVALMTRVFLIPKYEAAKRKQASDKPAASQQSSNPTSTMKSTTMLSIDALAKRQWDAIRKVIALICLDDGHCVHFALEQMMLNPHRQTQCDIPTSCGGACWRCAKPRITTPLDAAINIENFKAYLVRLFITDKVPSSRLSLHKDCFLDELLSIETPGPGGKPIKAFPKSVLGLTTNRYVRQRTKALIIKCFCAQILEPEVDGLHLLVKLGYMDNGNPRLNDPDSWTGFKSLPTKE